MSQGSTLKKDNSTSASYAIHVPPLDGSRSILSIEKMFDGGFDTVLFELDCDHTLIASDPIKAVTKRFDGISGFILNEIVFTENQIVWILENCPYIHMFKSSSFMFIDCNGQYMIMSVLSQKSGSEPAKLRAEFRLLKHIMTMNFSERDFLFVPEPEICR